MRTTRNPLAAILDALPPGYRRATKAELVARGLIEKPAGCGVLGGHYYVTNNGIDFELKSFSSDYSSYIV